MKLFERPLLALFPRRCAYCGKPVAPERGSCRKCEAELPRIKGDICLRCGRLSFDTKSRVASADGQPLSLTRKECGVLEYLLLHQGRPVSQEELMEHVWDGSVDCFSNSIRVHISALRKKLRAALGYDPICNRIGEGYEIKGESR